MSYFNSQPHEEADIGYLTYWIFPPLFQLTASRRGWQSECSRRECAKDISTHSLTKRLTSFRRYIAWFVLFQLTASRRGWLPGRNHLYLHFEISTHSLTKRLTENRPEWSGWWEISTHSLTKRLTLFVALWERTDLHFNSQPHEEADVGGDVTAVSCNIFQLTASRRGWRYRHLIFLLFQNISTHSLTKRLTRNDVCSEISEIFQLTASRRGWHRPP